MTLSGLMRCAGQTGLVRPVCKYTILYCGSLFFFSFARIGVERASDSGAELNGHSCTHLARTHRGSCLIRALFVIYSPCGSVQLFVATVRVPALMLKTRASRPLRLLCAQAHTPAIFSAHIHTV